MNEFIFSDPSEIERISVRAKPGVYVSFRPVDGKGLFKAFFQTERLDFGTDLQCVEDYWAVYKVEHGIAWLVCVFTKREEVSAQALEIVLKDYPHLLKDGVI
jgi:hypothetical protein